MKKIAVFASGSGSDFQSVIDANEKQPFCEIALLVASKEGIGAIDRAKKHGIDYIVRSKRIILPSMPGSKILRKNCGRAG